MADAQYAALRVKHGERAREIILNDAGRVQTHRQTLTAIRAQTLTAEQRQQVEAMARALGLEHAIHCELLEMGYANYLNRAQRGGLMPESWGRVVADAQERVGNIDISITDSLRDAAMAELGFFTQRDEEWSTPIAKSCDWEITAPESWGKPTAHNV
jgi:hypothetical protein